MFFTIILVVIIVLILFEWMRFDQMKKLDQKLGNNFLYIPLIGHMYKFFGSNEGRMEMFKKLAFDAYTNKHRASSAWFGPMCVPFISDPEQANIIIKATNCKGFISEQARRLVGNGLVFAPIKIWQPRRKVLLPSFSSRHLAQFVHIFESQSKVLVKSIESEVGKGNLSIWDYVTLYSLDSICETAFGINLKIQNQKANHPLFDALSKYLSNGSKNICKPWVNVAMIYNLLPLSAIQEELKKKIYKFIDDLIYKKKAIMSGEQRGIEDLNGVEPSRINMESFLEAMIKNSSESGTKYTLEELREEVLTLAIAGSDTSATGTCFTVTLLSQHPDIQEKVYQEIMEVLGEDKPIEMRDLQKLKYLDAVLKESLRLYPPVPILGRSTRHDIEISPDVVIPKHKNLVIHIWGLHHNPDYWGPDVEEFNPDRFISRPPPAAGAFIPFSTGPRNCIGYQYAMLSMKTNITTLLRSYRFKPATSFTYGKDNPLRTSFVFMLRHVNNYEIQIERRSRL